MPIKIDEHTVAGCPGCHSTNLLGETYFNHLTGKIVNMLKCEDCGMIFEPEEVVRITELPPCDSVADLKILTVRIDYLEKRVEELTKLLKKTEVIPTLVKEELDKSICPNCGEQMFYNAERRINGRRWYKCPRCHTEVDIKEGKNE